MNPEERSDPPDSAPQPQQAQPSRRRRLLPLLLAAGLIASVAPVVQRLPHEHRIDFKIEDDVASVQRFDVSWTHLDGDVEGEAVAGNSLRFERGSAPEIVSVHVRLPNGSYALDVMIEHADHTDSIQRRVTLGDADRITIPLRADPMRP
jgi:hypothetical protein